MQRDRILQLRDFHGTALLDDTVAFWTKHSVDREAGGFFTCLERDGSVYCTDKPVWFMGRATWLYATLYRLVEPRPQWMELARHGAEFLERHCFDQRGKLYFCVTREGRPLRMRRYVFSEVFATLGFSALAAITGDERIRQRAVELFGSFIHYIKTPGRIEPKVNPDTRPMKSLSPLMCLLDLADAMLSIDDDRRYEQILTETVDEIFADFVKADDGMMLETVGPAGERLDTPRGRCISPGHSLETAWFLMEVARRREDASLARRAAKIVDWSFERGWDREYGGLLYFVDVEGKPSPYLEHDMKLWWPHSEALYATLLAYHLTGDTEYARLYEQVHEWTFAHFPDEQFGEWFGYLHRDGSLSTDLKGNLWKGPFHIPRSQLLCWKLLERITSES
ncbi:MAG: AGE family epimerase/isomerase [Phycisphaerales bacterium]|nr:MAG: AGE family epimerase/isomerase [Phycisphaerales bacterium]